MSCTDQLTPTCADSQVMEVEEVVEFAGHAQALLINIGTRSSATEAASKLAAAEYRRLGKPWVLGGLSSYPLLHVSHPTAAHDL